MLSWYGLCGKCDLAQWWHNNLDLKRACPKFFNFWVCTEDFFNDLILSCKKVWNLTSILNETDDNISYIEVKI